MMSRRKQSNPQHLGELPLTPFENGQPASAPVDPNVHQSNTEGADEVNGDVHVCGKCRGEFIIISEFLEHKETCCKDIPVVIVNEGAQHTDSENRTDNPSKDEAADTEGRDGERVIDETNEEEEEEIKNLRESGDEDIKDNSEEFGIEQRFTPEVPKLETGDSHHEPMDFTTNLPMKAENSRSPIENSRSPLENLRSQFMNGLTSLPLPPSNFALHNMEHTKYAVSQICHSLSPSMSPPTREDMAMIQDQLYALQQQHLQQLNLIQHIQNQVNTYTSTQQQQKLAPPPTSTSPTSSTSSTPTLPAAPLPASRGPPRDSPREAPPAPPPPPPISSELLSPPRSSHLLSPPTRSAASSMPPSFDSLPLPPHSRTPSMPGILSPGAFPLPPHHRPPFELLQQAAIPPISSPLHSVPPSPFGRTSGPGGLLGLHRSGKPLNVSVFDAKFAADDPFFRHKCRFCHKVFGSDSALQIHIRSHTGERPFKCNICGNRFSTKGNLKVHFQRHQARYPHVQMDINPHPPSPPPQERPTPIGPSSSAHPPSIHQVPIPSIPNDVAKLPMETTNAASHQAVQPASGSLNTSAESDEFPIKATTNEWHPPMPSPTGSLPDERPQRPISAPPRPASEPARSPTEPRPVPDNPRPASSSELSAPRYSLTSESPHENQQPMRSAEFMSPMDNQDYKPPMNSAEYYGNELGESTYNTPSSLKLLAEQGFRPSETSKLQELVENIEQKITDPNQCVICHRVLSCKSALQMHYRIHTGERPFRCRICSRSFTTKGNLKTHYGVHRTQSPIRAYHDCPICQKRFTNEIVLHQHLRLHAAEGIPLPNSMNLMMRPQMGHYGPEIALQRPMPMMMNGMRPPHHERERIDSERSERDRLNSDRSERDRLNSDRSERDRLNSDRSEHSRNDNETLERSQQDSDRSERSHEDSEWSSRDRRDSERSQQSQMDRERSERVSLDGTRLEQIHLERERMKQARLNQEISEHAHLSRERSEQAHLDRERSEQAYLERERSEQAHFDRERSEQAHLARERSEQIHLERERSEQARFDRERSEQAHLERETSEQVYHNSDRLEQPHHNRERSKQDHLDSERPELAGENLTNGLGPLSNGPSLPNGHSEEARLAHDNDKEFAGDKDDSAENEIPDEGLTEKQIEEAMFTPSETSQGDAASPRASFTDDSHPQSEMQQFLNHHERQSMELHHHRFDHQRSLDNITNALKMKMASMPLNNNTEIHGHNGAEQYPEPQSPFNKSEANSMTSERPSEVPSVGEDHPDFPLHIDESSSRLDSNGVLDLTARSSGETSPSMPQSQGLPTSTAAMFAGLGASNLLLGQGPGGLIYPPGRRPISNNTTCRFCGKVFACTSALQIHYRSHTKERPFKCEICGKGFSTRGNLKQHMLTHKIRDLPTQLFDPSQLHKPVVPLPPHMPEKPDISRFEKSRPDITRHESPRHDVSRPENTKTEIPRPESSQSENSRPENPRVENLRPENAQMDILKYENSRQVESRPEMARPEMARPEMARPEMTRPEMTRPEMTRPEMTRSVEDSRSEHKRPEHIRLDSARYDMLRHEIPRYEHSRSESDLDQQRVHPSLKRPSPPDSRENEPPMKRTLKHQCRVCEKQFQSDSALQIHMRTHTGEKPFKCHICARCFTTKGNMKVHMGTHMWNGGTRRGRRIAFDPPLLISPKEGEVFRNDFLGARPPFEGGFFQYPSPLNGFTALSKANEISVIQNHQTGPGQQQARLPESPNSVIMKADGPNPELRELRELREMQENKIREMHESSMRELHENSIREMHEKSFREMHESKIRELHESKIRELHESKMRELHENKIREMHENSIREMRDNTLRELRESAMREMRENALREMRESTMREMQKNAMRDLKPEVEPERLTTA